MSRRWFLATLFCVLVSGCQGPQQRPEEPPPSSPGNGNGMSLEVIADGLETPWEVAFAPDGRIFVSERPGRIRVIENGTLREQPWATVPTYARSEAGLQGIALHPDFPTSPFLYAYYTFAADRGAADRDENGAITNRVVRLRDQDGQGVGEEILLDDLPGGPAHDGGRIAFGPDRLLYVSVGDALSEPIDYMPVNPRLVLHPAQDRNSLAGKILRMDLDGSVPASNPFANSYVYTMGHRDVQGLCWHPVSGLLYSSEHGTDHDDEVNILEPGRNYGWPLFTGTLGAPGYEAAIHAWNPVIAPAGCAFTNWSRAGGPPELAMVIAGLRFRPAPSGLHTVFIDPQEPRRVSHVEVGIDGEEFGRLRAARTGPDGALYLTTSNREGTRDPEGDKVLRITWGGPP